MNQKRQKWSVEKLQKEASKYEARNEFKKGSPKAYDRARKLKILNDICVHMKPQRECWTYDKIIKAASEFTTRHEFQLQNSKAYDAAKHHGVLDEVCAHMISVRITWNEKLAKEEALKYNSRMEFKANCPVAYRYVCANSILDEVCAHMDSRIYWDKKSALEEALKYTTRSDFRELSGSAYNFARKNGFLDEACSHMIKVGSLLERTIYVILFPKEQMFYAGLTYNLNERIASHKSNSSNKLVKSLMERGEPFDTIVYKENVAMDLAGFFEQEAIEKYLKDGLYCLNLNKPGGLGGAKKVWTKEKILEESRNYKTRTEFRDMAPGAYDAAKELIFLDEACSHMELKMTKWNERTILTEAAKYDSLNELLSKARNIYMAAFRRGILDKIKSLYC